MEGWDEDLTLTYAGLDVALATSELAWADPSEPAQAVPWTWGRSHRSSVGRPSAGAGFVVLGISSPYATSAGENYAQVVTVKNPKTAKKSKAQIFPRFHQLDVVRRLLADVEANGAGRRYLVEHSAGSGKSNSIAWLAHQLTTARFDGTAAFDSVIVVTDRVILDRQIDATIKGFTQVGSTVVHADRSTDLRAAIEAGKKVIVTTVQKFPYIVANLGTAHRDRRFAVIIDASRIDPGTTVVVDAGAGAVIQDPDAELVASVERRRHAAEALAQDRSPGATADGHLVPLLANIGTPQDAVRAAEGGAEGVGLFRTEVLFLDRRTPPDVGEQAATYRQVFEAFPGRKVVVRTLDAGADKPLAFARQATEENPALGVRGYRLVRTMPELIATQLEALAAAARDTGAEVAVMAPMIATVAEAAQFAERARAAGLGNVGVMVEVPAAALQAPQVLEAVDFVSLGTNDLAQYTMATDRLRGELADLLDPWQPAVLQLAAATASAGYSASKPVGVCGESAADPLMALVLVGLGVTSLSMAPAAAPAVRFALRFHTLEECRAIAAAATSAPDAVSARQAALARVSADVRSVLDL